MRVDVRLQPRQPRMLLLAGDAVLQVRGRCARTARVDEGERLVEAHFLDQLHGLVEVGIGLAGEADDEVGRDRSEEHTSEVQSLMRISYAVFCLKKKNIEY